MFPWQIPQRSLAHVGGQPEGTRPIFRWAALLGTYLEKPNCVPRALPSKKWGGVAVVSKRQPSLEAARTRRNFEVLGEAAWVRPPNLQRVVASSCWTLATVRGQGLPA
ncbi:hypothetical protein DMX02_13335 [Pseudomonas jessenii]|nr:hypothetical protein DMX02_13335 [Pseudomonas jessenii]